MEGIFFGIIIGLLIAFGCIGIGVVIGENISEGKLHNDNNNSNVCNNDSNNNNSSVGDNNKQINNRCDIEQGCYKEGRITDGCAARALEVIKLEMRRMLSQTEIDALDRGIEVLGD